MKIKSLYSALAILLCISTSFSQEKKTYLVNTIAFYNLENLYDTINDETINDEASPMMELKSNKSKVYWQKINNMAIVIAQIGAEKANTGPSIIGVSEIVPIKMAVKTPIVKIIPKYSGGRL